MNKHKLMVALTILFSFFILWVIVMADIGEGNILFSFVYTLPYGDKIGHICIFGLLTLGLNLSLKFKSFGVSGLNIYYGTSIIFSFAVIEEASQYFIPSRTFDIVDLIASTIGIMIFTAISKSIKNKPLSDISHL